MDVFEFRDCLDSRGQNIIDVWLNVQGQDVRANFDDLLSRLAMKPIAEWRSTPQVSPLQGNSPLAMFMPLPSDACIKSKMAD